MKVRDLLDEGTDKLNKAGIDNAAYDARQLLMRAYGKTSAELLADMDRNLCAGATGGEEPQDIDYCPGDCGARINYDDFIARRAKHVPLQHILGSAWFMGLEFRVNKDVLIPRQDTELLVETVLEREKDNAESVQGRDTAAKNAESAQGRNVEANKAKSVAVNRKTMPEELPQINNPAADSSAHNVDSVDKEIREISNINAETGSKAAAGLRLLDLCTGSGCIAISLKKLGGYSHVAASDYSEAALSVARDNARANGTDITFIHSDMFADIDETFDVIVSNPPYIPSRDIEELQPEVKDYDPMTALDGGTDGLDFYRIIAEKAGTRLKPQGRLYLEIGCDQAEAVSTLLKDNGYCDIEVLKDLNGKDRVVLGRLAD